MKGLKKFLRQFETIMTAETFAEAGEFETARKVLRDNEVHLQKRTVIRANRAYKSDLAVAGGNK
ncbi:MAG: hypothetical protein Q7U68_02835 [Candidatus Roizmanbacteria bacterium]|nr:hypothetical protein [Candidatus Roizmanbacteria bacterium]